ncbi:MAG: hypothetical protein J07HX64_01251 [halophilic archaeon J07HX64]|jgi:hypothetical protein|nr:MAG: hypothetical protein J07HX64_01251 [halophilic archaeon J07HX64]
MNRESSRKFTAAFFLVQGLLTALAPQLSVKFVKRLIGRNFDNAGDIEAKPAYLRQLRAVGVGMVAAGGTTLLLEELLGSTDDSAETDIVEDADDFGETDNTGETDLSDDDPAGTDADGSTE